MMFSMVQRLISAYIDRELSEFDRARVRRHLAVCSECYAVYEATLAVKNALSSMAPAECPHCLWDGIEARITASPLGSPKGGPSPLRFLRSLASFAKIVAPAAVVGALIAVPVVQYAFNIDLIGPMSARVASTVEQRQEQWQEQLQQQQQRQPHHQPTQQQSSGGAPTPFPMRALTVGTTSAYGSAYGPAYGGYSSFGSFGPYDSRSAFSGYSSSASAEIQERHAFELVLDLLHEGYLPHLELYVEPTLVKTGGSARD